MKTVAKLKSLWGDFIDIIGDLKLDFCSNDETMNLKGKIRTWLADFLDLYQTKDVTPYMHALYAHVPEFLSLYTNTGHYTQQGVEKYNDRASKDYFRSTKHRGISELRQLFLKKNRVQYRT